MGQCTIRSLEEFYCDPYHEKEDGPQENSGTCCHEDHAGCLLQEHLLQEPWVAFSSPQLQA